MTTAQWRVLLAQAIDPDAFALMDADNAYFAEKGQEPRLMYGVKKRIVAALQAADRVMMVTGELGDGD